MKNNNQIDASLVLFGLAFFVLIFGVFSKVVFREISPVMLTPTPSIQQNTSLRSHKINYSLPMLCDYKTKESSISAMADRDSIMVTLIKGSSSQKYVVQGDCLYAWNTGEHKGKKRCGFGSYIKIGRQLLGSDDSSLSSMISMLPQTKGISINDVHSALSSCINIPEVKKEVFVIPDNISFEEAK